VYCGLAKGTSWAEVMPKSEKVEPVALVLIGMESEAAGCMNSNCNK